LKLFREIFLFPTDFAVSDSNRNFGNPFPEKSYK